MRARTWFCCGLILLAGCFEDQDSPTPSDSGSTTSGATGSSSGGTTAVATTTSSSSTDPGQTTGTECTAGTQGCPCIDQSCDDGLVCIDDLCRLCGNGVLDDGEDCDDGNVGAGDGCSATCSWEEHCVVLSLGGEPAVFDTLTLQPSGLLDHGASVSVVGTHQFVTTESLATNSMTACGGHLYAVTEDNDGLVVLDVGPQGSTLATRDATVSPPLQSVRCSPQGDTLFAFGESAFDVVARSYTIANDGTLTLAGEAMFEAPYNTPRLRVTHHPSQAAWIVLAVPGDVTQDVQGGSFTYDTTGTLLATDLFSFGAAGPVRAMSPFVEGDALVVSGLIFGSPSCLTVVDALADGTIDASAPANACSPPFGRRGSLLPVTGRRFLMGSVDGDGEIHLVEFDDARTATSIASVPAPGDQHVAAGFSDIYIAGAQDRVYSLRVAGDQLSILDSIELDDPTPSGSGRNYQASAVVPCPAP